MHVASFDILPMLTAFGCACFVVAEHPLRSSLIWVCTVCPYPFVRKVWYIAASKRKKELNHVRTIIEGNHGIKGKNKDCHGKNADHLCIEVCTSIFDVSII